MPPIDTRWAIFDLVARFDDAVNRRDLAEFAGLWVEDSVWEIDEPRPLRVEGLTAIVSKWSEMLGATRWLFRGSFAGVVDLAGDTATGRWPCVETGTFLTGEGYDNRSIYEDRYRLTPGGWRFVHRRYVYLWLSSEALPGHEISRDRQDASDG